VHYNLGSDKNYGVEGDEHGTQLREGEREVPQGLNPDYGNRGEGTRN